MLSIMAAKSKFLFSEKQMQINGKFNLAHFDTTHQQKGLYNKVPFLTGLLY